MYRSEKIIVVGVGIIMLLVGLALPSPENPTTDMARPDSTNLIIVNSDQTVDRGSTLVAVDTETGCQYIVLRGFRTSGRANGITARLDKNGQPMCGLNE